MAFLLITNSGDKLPDVINLVPEMDLQDLVFSPTYNINKLIEGAKSGDVNAEEELKNILEVSNKLGYHLGINIVKALYGMDEFVVRVDGALLLGSDIKFITETLGSKYNIIILNFHDNNVDLFNPACQSSYVTVETRDLTIELLAKVGLCYKENKINQLLDEVEEELKTLEVPVPKPIDMPIKDLIQYLIKEWKDETINELTIVDIAKLIGYELTPLKDD